MTNPTGSKTEGAWELIEIEKKRDRFIRRVAKTAWGATFVLLILFAALFVAPVMQFVKGAAAGDIPWMTVLGLALPFMGMLWTLVLLIATLSTVAVFLRLRTASLTEIQLRLAALEEMLSSKS
jgi:Flp pilus assembly protein protease CpaA